MASKTGQKKKKKTTTRKKAASGTKAAGAKKKKSAKKSTSRSRKTAAAKKAGRSSSAKTARKSRKKKKAASRSAAGKKTSAGKKKKTTKAASSRKKTTKTTKTTKKTPTKTKKKSASKKTKKTAKTAKTAKKTAKVSKRKKTASTKSDSGSGRSVAHVASMAGADKDGYVLINGRKVRMISTKGFDRTKRKPTAAEKDATTPSGYPLPEEIAKIKTPLSAKELREFRELLLTKRAELIGDLDSLEHEALRSGSGDISHMPIHMADIGTDAYDQDFMLNLAENERQRIREIDDALSRIENRSYGVCQMTGKPIPNSRLKAKPWAKYTIEAAELIEKGYGRP